MLMPRISGYLLVHSGIAQARVSGSKDSCFRVVRLSLYLKA